MEKSIASVITLMMKCMSVQQMVNFKSRIVEHRKCRYYNEKEE